MEHLALSPPLKPYTLFLASLQVTISGSGKIVAVAAERQDSDVSNNSGAVYLYKAATAKEFQPLQPAKLAPVSVDFANFGRTTIMSADGKFILGGAPYVTSGSGTGKVYTYTASK